MKNLTARLLMGAALLGGAVCAQAQWNGTWRGDSRSGYGGQYEGRNGRGGDAIGNSLRDLDRIGSFAWNGHERKQVDQARNDLMRFEDKWRSGRWDGGRLDNAIGHIQNLVNSGRISPRDRDMLVRDLYSLRDFRSNRGYGYGYRRY
jgi:hypothetical protein